MIETHLSPAASASVDVAVRTFVLDTSVLLSDPRALKRFAEHDVVLPVVVITELELKAEWVIASKKGISSLTRR